MTHQHFAGTIRIWGSAHIVQAGNFEIIEQFVFGVDCSISSILTRVRKKEQLVFGVDCSIALFSHGLERRLDKIQLNQQLL
ncbi:hypothetical protein MKW98_030357 [Papaver atlanticum]|uniref:Uncharacterized protein n=1 Tax=Papaver atlanticum TaxID=357466 RepID=A0AAD4XXU3_9MAGN|nr:hypothetical protein MKW98_030357 [Papaver atlanticum]